MKIINYPKEKDMASPYEGHYAPGVPALKELQSLKNSDFTVPDGIGIGTYKEWLLFHGGVLMYDETNWHLSYITFENDNDAIAFKLRYM